MGEDGGRDGSRENSRLIFTRLTMMTNLGIELVSRTDETAQLALVGDERHQNYLGQLHGGAIMAALDTAAFMPGNLLPSGRKLATEGVEVHFFQPAPLGERVLFNARILRNGRRVVTVEAEAVSSAGLKLAHAIITLLDLEA